jgi:hypothetical protein
MKQTVKDKQSSGFERIHQAKIRSRRAQIRARAEDKSYSGFCLAKHVDPEILSQGKNGSDISKPRPKSFASSELVLGADRCWRPYS